MDATLQDPFVGRVLDGRYRVESRIARGGMATVYLAVDDRLDREVALKVMHGHLADDEQFVARFIREARSAARLSHPNVVQVFDQGSDAGVLYLAMEHLAGRTLRDVLAEKGALTPREALSVLEPVLDALAAAHRAGIVHRDIKPENVLLTDDGRVKVADFGLARAMTTSTATSGTLIGTVAYLSPELVARGVADARTDVYAAGILLFEALTGTPPFTGEVPIQVAFQHVHEQVPPPSDLVPSLPIELDGLVLAATAQDPDDRPDDAGRLLTMLRTVRRGLSPAVLDHRPGVGHVPAAGETEVVDRPVAVHHTQAFPPAALPPAVPSAAVAASRPPGHDLRPRGRDVDLRELDDDPVVLSGRVMNRRRRRGSLLLVAVLTLAAALGGGAWWSLAGPGAFTATPMVVGLPLAEATAQLQTNGLSAEITEVFDDVAPPGQVVSAVPEPGEDVRKGGSVSLSVSKGPELFEVPALVGLTPDEAKAALAPTGLAAGEATQAYDATVPEGRIVSSAPAAGQSLRRGEEVTFVVSRGPEPIKVPDLVGKKRDDAVRALEELGLKVATGEEQSDSTAKDRVISQDPTSGTLLPGSTVSLIISTGPPLVQVPDVNGKMYEDAKRELESVGFTVRREGSTILNRVFDQSPRAGDTAPRGSEITLRTF